MQNAEDEADAAAAVEAEKEAADELAEFTVEPPPVALNPNSHVDLDPENEADNLDENPEEQNQKACTDDTSSVEKGGKDDEAGSVKDEEIKQNDDDPMDSKDQEGVEDVAGDGQTCDEAVNAEEEEGFGGLNQGMVGSEQMAELLEQFTPIEKFAIRVIEEVSWFVSGCAFFGALNIFKEIILQCKVSIKFINDTKRTWPDSLVCLNYFFSFIAGLFLSLNSKICMKPLIPGNYADLHCFSICGTSL